MTDYVFGNNKDYRAGLVLHLDAANKRSWGGGGSLISMSSWDAGGTGSVGGFNANQSTATENMRLNTTGPWGSNRLVWETRPSGDTNTLGPSIGGPDGGWDRGGLTVDPSKLYRYSVWVRKTVDVNDGLSRGAFYFGAQQGGYVHTLDGMAPHQTGPNGTDSNPYFAIWSYDSLPLNTWFLVVSHVFPHTYTGTTHVNSGVYQTNGLKWDRNVYAQRDYRHAGPTATAGTHRTYHYYSQSSQPRLQFYNPRVDLCDGNEPTIEDLLADEYKWKDLSGKGNHGILVTTGNIPALPVLSGTSFNVPFNNKYMTFDFEQTVVAWFKVNSLSVRMNYYDQAYGGGGTVTIETAGSINYYAGTSGSNSGAYWNLSLPSVVVGQYVMFAHTRNQSTVRGYKNGAFSGTSPFGASKMVTGTNNITIGSGYTNPLNGELAKLMVYDRALSDQEITDLYNGTKTRFGI